MIDLPPRSPRRSLRAAVLVAATCAIGFIAVGPAHAIAAESRTRVALANGQWTINGRPTNPGSPAEGLLMNVRMVNALFEDLAVNSDFDPEANTDRFIARIPDYGAQGVNAFTVSLQGGMPGYEGAVNSAFESVTGMPYDRFAIDALFKPLGIERWWFQSYEGAESIGTHPSHGMGMPARDLARIAYCLLRGGRWGDRQIVPKWFVDETAASTHDVTTPEMRWKLNPRVFSHGWELPALHRGEDGRSGEGIPSDARSKPGSGGQIIAFVPSLDLVVTRQTGGSGNWEFEEFLRRACAAVVTQPAP